MARAVRADEPQDGRAAGRAVGELYRMGCLVLLGAILTASQLVRMPGYVLDDWYSYRNVWFGGPWAAADHDLRVSRPGAGLAFGIAFGYTGHNQVTQVLVRMTLVVLASVLGYLLLRRFFPREIPLLVAAAWLLLPNHLSLELWSSAFVASVSLVTLLGGCVLLAERHLRWWKIAVACGLFALSALTYESSAVVAAVAAVVLPWLVAGRLRCRPVVAVAVTLSATTLWTLTNWHDVKSVHNDLSQYTDLFQAHFGWGILPTGAIATVGLLLGTVGVTLVLVRVITPSRRARAVPADWLVVSGLVVMLLGSATFALYYYAPLGAGDRVSYVSSLGGAMVMVGLLWHVWARRQAVGVGFAVLLVLGASVARVQRLDIWFTAGRDGDRIFRAIEQVDDSCTTVYLGPAPIQRENVAAFLDQSNVDGAVQVALDRRDVRGVMLFDQASFDRVPEGCRVDIRPLSELEPDAVVGPT